MTNSKPEIASQKRTIKLAPSIGDWTTYRPPKILVKKVKTGLYGFDRLSRKELNRALLVHYHFIQDLLNGLKVDLGVGVEFYSCQAEQTTYLNFLRTLTGQVVQGKLSIPGIHEKVHVFFDLAAANSIINHALGSHDTESLNRGLTEAENNILTTTFTEYLPACAFAFETFSIVSSPDVTIDPSINPSSTFVVFSLEVAINNSPPAKIFFGYPGSALKSLIESFLAKEKEKPLDFSRLSAAALKNILVKARANLGKTTLLSHELHSLEVGDVVSLDTPTNSAVSLTVGSWLKLAVQPGITNKKKGVRIAGFGDEEKIKLSPPAQIPEEIEKEPGEKTEILPKEELAEEEEEFPEEDLFDEEEEFPVDEEEELPKEEV
ncbi:MAG: FliM/FliN family flagellar motor switch protein [Candidatus Margulisiibacteriota bacterium]